MRTMVIVTGLAGCIDTMPQTDNNDRREALCDYIAECAPVQTRGVDWSNVRECVEAIADVEACEVAWEYVRCIPEGATLEDVMASTPSIRAAMEVCL